MNPVHRDRRLGLIRAALTTVIAVGMLPGCFVESWIPGMNTGPPVRRTLSTTGAGQGLSPVTSDAIDELDPSLSPDGRTLLLQTIDPDGRGAIVGIDPGNGASRTILTDANQSALSPCWSSASQFIYSSDSMGDRAIVRGAMGAAGAAMAVVVPGQAAPEADNPTVARDRIAFDMDVRGARVVVTANMDGSSMTVLGEGIQPRFSPDGRRLAFVRTVNGYNQLFTADARSGAGMIQVTNHASNNDAPTWDPSGRYILFSSDRSGTAQIYAVKSDGTGMLQLTRGNAQSTSPHWGHDGWIYFASDAQGNWDVWRMQPAGDLTT